jgi:hypothetical protein
VSRLLETAEEEGCVTRRSGSGESPSLREERSSRDVVMSAIASGIRQRRQVHTARFSQARVETTALGLLNNRFKLASRQLDRPVLLRDSVSGGLARMGRSTCGGDFYVGRSDIRGRRSRF